MLQIRKAQPNDRDYFMQACRRFYQSEAVDHQIPSTYMETTFTRSIADDPYTQLWMLDFEAMPIGYLLLSFTYSNEVGGLVVLGEELWLEASVRGQGFGTQVLEWLKRQFAEAKRIRLDVTDVNVGAIALYKREGFAMLGYHSMVYDR